MLPALEGEIKLKDESAQTFDQVVANAMKANQALKGTQAETLKQTGTDTASTLGEEVVRQATEGAYGTRAIDAIINQMTAAEERLKKSGKDAGNWWGTALTATIRQNTPQELLDILIVELIPLMTKALAAEAERGGVAP